MSSHVLAQLDAHRSRHAPQGPCPPLIVGVQGPQGSGKTFLTSHLRDALQDEPHKLSVTVFSLDDLYLPHEALVRVAQTHPNHALLQGRGQPGTHDIRLGRDVFDRLKRINDPGAGITEVKLPAFDKSKFNGEGDRVPGSTVRPPVDVVLFEGWCTGFYPIDHKEVERRWTSPVIGLGDNFFKRKGYSVEEFQDINGRLEYYIPWWNSIDAFIQITPPDDHPLDFIYKWRLQQEHHMKALNGGKGMTDGQVEAFVDRYIPGYVLFNEGVVNGWVDNTGTQQTPPWIGRGLRVQIGGDRELLQTSAF
ncbi:P-loop containing nucleoside triphosphate hydrolase protein [Epithele typhae]|uniref:P-loop containing nucleoside triphosphate hydrolase protein n=1 Tax=Epithele typhae TaxID=378194 RepID=UPI0020075075|nr:P-loop containing nucleoside triphosphate hydrolase protein [Epithele typhae]KAH9942188.1 P-loop containing nucleoside triphosphate hydrolase protein [Epithele typhae]